MWTGWWNTRVRTRECHTQLYCNTLQHTATHCNTLQHTATHCNIHNCRYFCFCVHRYTHSDVYVSLFLFLSLSHPLSHAPALTLLRCLSPRPQSLIQISRGPHTFSRGFGSILHICFLFHSRCNSLDFSLARSISFSLALSRAFAHSLALFCSFLLSLALSRSLSLSLARPFPRGGGLGSRPIFKKFHETYAPS